MSQPNRPAHAAPAEYAGPPGGLPGQRAVMTDRAIFTPAYAVLPHGTMRDIVTSRLPGWRGTRVWMLARPLSGFAETFAYMVVELEPDGGSERPDPAQGSEAVLFVTQGRMELSLDGEAHSLGPGSYVYLAPGTVWQIHNPGPKPAQFHWIRKRFQSAAGLAPPTSFVTEEAAQSPVEMAGSAGAWTTTRFVDPLDLRHDMHVNIVNFEPGGSIPFAETHVMEHGIYVLEGKAVYRLNGDWVEVEAGDFIWLRAFCPQACVAAGPVRFRYLLYKDVNRHPPLDLAGAGGAGWAEDAG
ncbi:MAG: bifunctional allantoicase/(S)-ureidoglycine aminohydrolase [Pseudomonadota bacterium]